MNRPIEHVSTTDGARIACKRLPSSGPPIVLLHGIAVNADVWDCPEIRGDNFVFRSLPTLLAEAGYDIWLVNLRGHGAPHMLSAPAAGQIDWCVDHFVLYDLPAVIEHVRRGTGRGPFLIGSSMGAMTIAGCLQGATLVGYGESQAIVADEACARRRQADVAGCVLVEFPAALRWPRSFYGESGSASWSELLRELQNPDAGSNYPFELMARWPWLETLLSVSGAVRLDWLRPRGGPPSDIAASPDFATRVKAAAMRWYSERFKAAENFQIETFTNGLLRAADHMQAGVLRQMGKCVRGGSFVSALGAPDHVYSDHYDMIACPTLVIVGGRDRIASAEVTRELFFDRIRSSDRAFKLYESIAHGEFEYAPIASETVYPEILAWLAARTGQATCRPTRPTSASAENQP